MKKKLKEIMDLHRCPKCNSNTTYGRTNKILGNSIWGICSGCRIRVIEEYDKNGNLINYEYEKTNIERTQK